jgi:hypothetical protein
VEELVNMTYDVSGWPNRQNVIVDMTQQDHARVQQQQQAPAQQQAAQLQHEAQMEQVQTANKAQLLDRASVDKAGELFFKHVFEHADEAATGDK